MLIRLRDSYLTGTGPVHLDVTIGDGQRAYVEVSINGTVLDSGSQITQRLLGGGPELAGKRLRVTSTVTDTNPSTNHTAVTYVLRHGQSEKRWVSDHTVDVEGGTVDYDAIFMML